MKNKHKKLNRCEQQRKMYFLNHFFHTADDHQVLLHVYLEK